jgi:hypothetical protein
LEGHKNGGTAPRILHIVIILRQQKGVSRAARLPLPAYLPVFGSSRLFTQTLTSDKLFRLVDIDQRGVERSTAAAKKGRHQALSSLPSL